MTTKQTLLDLAEQCEKADGPDRGLDEKIERITGNYTAFGFYTLGDNDFDEYIPTRYTSSLDAAMTLLTEGWFTSNYHAGWSGGHWWELSCIRDDLQQYISVKGHAKIPALALTAAALRAKAQEIV